MTDRFNYLVTFIPTYAVEKSVEKNMVPVQLADKFLIESALMNVRQLLKQEPA